MLTLTQLKQMPMGTIFAKGEIENSPDGVFMTRKYPGRMIRWLAKRGHGQYDWTIYLLWADKSWAEIESVGDKPMGESNIRKMVKCDDEAFNAFRR